MTINNNNNQVYTLNGTLVFLAYTDDMPNVAPIEVVGNIGAYSINDYNGCDVCLTTDDVYSAPSDGGTAIIAANCVNPENGQKLVEGWWTEQYSKEDEFNREYLTTTDSYYDWTSERTRMINRINGASHEGVITADDYTGLKTEWDNAVKEYCSDDTVFDALLDEAGVTVCAPITSAELVEDVQSGAVYCSNGDTAHTDSYPDDQSDIIRAIHDCGFHELTPGTEDYDIALDRLELSDSDNARIFTAGCYTFAPDLLRD